MHNFPGVVRRYERFTRLLRNAPPRATLPMITSLFWRLVIQRVDNRRLEMQLLSLLDAIPDAIDADPKLGGHCCSGGMAYITEGRGRSFAMIGRRRPPLLTIPCTCLKTRGDLKCQLHALR